MDITFSGGGFMGVYYFGVLDCWNKYIPRERVNRVAGVSAGSLTAAYYLLDLPMEDCLQEVIGLVENYRSRALGVFDRSHQMVDVLPTQLNRIFPEDAHKKCSGRLHIGMTNKKDMKHVIVNEFETKLDLIDALNCSCFIPVWSGNRCSTYKGTKYIDGGITDNLPVFDENTIRICCFAGKTDISPKDRTKLKRSSRMILNMPLYMTMANFRRGAAAVWPPHPSLYLDMLERGYQDTKLFLLENDLIQCEECYQKSQKDHPDKEELKFSMPNPTISPALRRKLPPDASNNSFSDDSGYLMPINPTIQQQALDEHRDKLIEKRSRSPDSMESTQEFGFNDDNLKGTPNITITTNDQENASPTLQKNTTLKKGGGGDEKPKKKKSCSSSMNTLSARRKSQAALASGFLEDNFDLLKVEDKFTVASNEPLPSCPPSPNFNRHCKECFRLRESARLSQLDESVRQVAESFCEPSKVPTGSSKNPLRWIRHQLKPKHSYKFPQEAAF